jgi:activating signal cointegrator 1
MRALSLLEPWGSLIACGAKSWETRGWKTNYRGLIAIHTSKAWKQDQILAIAGSKPMWDRLVAEGFDWRVLAKDGCSFPLASIIAVADLTDVIPSAQWLQQYNSKLIKFPHPTFEASRLERECGNYEAGRFAWKLENVRKLATPIPCKGALNLWNVPEEVEREVTRQLSAA